MHRTPDTYSRKVTYSSSVVGTLLGSTVTVTVCGVVWLVVVNVSFEGDTEYRVESVTFTDTDTACEARC